MEARRADYGRYIELRMAFTSPSDEDTMMVAQPIEFKAVPAGDYTGATLLLQPEEAQTMMDSLWDAGIRPTEGSGSAGSLAATERHLKDMQAIAMGLLRKDGMT